MLLVASLLAGLALTQASEIRTNQAVVSNPPAWMKAGKVQQVIDRIEYALEWDIRRIQVKVYDDASGFRRAHGYDATVLAFAVPADQSVHLGPAVTEKNFEAIFGHELVHVILQQKYKQAIPKWLEEGLANHLSKHDRVDYLWLSRQTLPEVSKMAHPFRAGAGGPKLHYQASTALMEMIASRCSVQDLLQLSVGKKLETYLRTYCEIADLDSEFRKWVARKSPSKSAR